MEIYIFNQKKVHSLDITKDSAFKFGGQGRAYTTIIDSKKYLLKVIPSITSGYQTLYSRPKILMKNMTDFQDTFWTNKDTKNKYEKTLEKIMLRGIPIGMGSCNASEFGYSNNVNECVYFLLNYIKGKGLDEYLTDDTPAFSKKRLKVASQILKIMSIFQEVGLIQADMTPDNFIINQNNEVYPIDLESAGLMVKNNKKVWELQWKPSSSGKPHIWPIAPEFLDIDKKKIGLKSDIFTGIYLIFWVITGCKPLDFMTYIDPESLKIIKSSSYKDNVWPPKFKKKIPDCVCKEKLKIFKTIMQVFKDCDSQFESVLFKTLITGYSNPEKRASIKAISKSLAPILN